MRLRWIVTYARSPDLCNRASGATLHLLANISSCFLGADLSQHSLSYYPTESRRTGDWDGRIADCRRCGKSQTASLEENRRSDTMTCGERELRRLLHMCGILHTRSWQWLRSSPSTRLQLPLYPKTLQ